MTRTRLPDRDRELPSLRNPVLIRFALGCLLLLGVVTSCSGNSERNAAATITALKLESLQVEATITATELMALETELETRLVVTQTGEIRAILNGDCDREGISGSKCGLIRWQDKYMNHYGAYVELDSDCWRDVLIGENLPLSCR